MKSRKTISLFAPATQQLGHYFLAGAKTMNQTTSGTNDLINITPMTAAEAKECDAAIHMHLDAADKHLDSAGALLLEMKRREGWKALNFGTWTEYLESRAAGGKSRRRALELLQAEEVRENLAMCGIPHMDIPTVTSQLTTLAQLPLEQQPEGLHKADELAMTEGKKRTANHIAKAVKEINCVAKEIEARGKSLGLPTRGDSVLPDSDRIDDLTHISPADVDDRPGAPPTQLQPVSHNYNTGFSMTTENMFAPTPAQWQAAQAKHAELLQALRDAQIEIEQLSAENLKLHEANSDLHQEIALLLTELAALKVPLQPQADA